MEKRERSTTQIQDKLFKTFLDGQSKKTRKVYASYFRTLLLFDSKLTGTRMLREKAQWEMKKCLEFKRFLEEKGYSQNYATNAVACLRGFFSANRKQLMFTNSEKRRINSRGNITEFFPFTKDNLRQIWIHHTKGLLDKWMLCNKSLGLRAEDFVKITYGRLRSLDLNQEAPVEFGAFLTEKEEVDAHPFLDVEVVSVVKELLETNMDKKDEDRVWPHRQQELNYRLRALVKAAKVQTGGQRVVFHNLRRFCYNALIYHMGQDCANLIIGKEVHEKPYISTEVREAFKRAMPDLLLVTNGNGEIRKQLIETRTELEDLKTENLDLKERITATEEKLGAIEKLLMNLKNQGS